MTDERVETFRERRPEAPDAGPRGTVWPEMDPGERGATCSVCGYWGIVGEGPALDAEIGRIDLVCQVCDAEIEDDDGSGYALDVDDVGVPRGEGETWDEVVDGLGSGEQ